jgi:hypothetical protein
MASDQKLELINQAITGNLTGGGKSLPARSEKLIAFLDVSVSSGGTVGGTIEHSPDGTNWFTLATFLGIGGVGVELLQIPTNSLGQLRHNLTISAGTATVKSEVRFDGSK